MIHHPLGLLSFILQSNEAQIPLVINEVAKALEIRYLCFFVRNHSQLWPLEMRNIINMESIVFAQTQ